MQIHALGHMAPLGCAPKPVLDRIVRRERDSGHAAAAAWLDAILRLDGYAREGGR